MADGFTVGDAVRARTSALVPSGTRGYIEQVLISVSDMYFVQFVGHHAPVLMRTHELERADSATAPDRERAVGPNAEIG